MAHEGGVTIDLSRVAAVDLSTYQYYAVRLDETSGKIKRCNGTSSALGILQNNPVTSRAGSIRVIGECKAWVSGTVLVQDRLGPVADACEDTGVLIATTTDNDEYVAIALEAHASNTKALRTVLVVGMSHYGHA